MARSIAMAIALAVGTASITVADEWSSFAYVSDTMGVNANRLCVGEASRGAIGCPATAPSVTTAGDVSVTGNLSANRFIGDGSGLTGVVASSGDRIVSGTTSMLAVSSTGFVSLTQAGVNTGWFDPQRGLVTLGVSATGGISGTTGYFSGRIGIGTTSPQAGIHMAGIGTQNIWLENQTSGGGSWGFNAKNDGSLGIVQPGLAEFMTILRTSGNVGIGTTAPSTTLHVSGSVTVGSTGNDIMVYGRRTDNVPLWSLGSNSGGAFTLGTYNTMNLETAFSGLMYFKPNGSTMFYLDPTTGGRAVFQNSSVGIGTATPNATLQVSGSLIVSTTGQTTTPSLFVASNGNVGVGTSIPRYGIHINGANDPALQITDSDFGTLSTDGTVLQQSGPNAYLWNYENGGIALATNNSERLTIVAGGNVGIGTINPSSTLHVIGTTSSSNVYGQNASFTTVRANTFIGDGSGLTGVVASSGDRIVSGTTSMLAVSSTGFVSLTQAGVNTGWFDPVRGLVTLGVSATGGISGTGGYFSGSLGIGVTNPAYLANFVGGTGGAESTLLELRSLGTNAGTGTNIRLTNSNNVGSAVRAEIASIRGSSADSNLIFRTSIGSGPIDRVTIASAGNVGIGISTPTTALDVSGTARITSNTVISGTIQIAGTGNEGCTAATIGTIRLNPITNRPQICRW